VRRPIEPGGVLLPRIIQPSRKSGRSLSFSSTLSYVDARLEPWASAFGINPLLNRAPNISTALKVRNKFEKPETDEKENEGDADLEEC
jgi:hypothetical protein